VIFKQLEIRGDVGSKKMPSFRLETCRLFRKGKAAQECDPCSKMIVFKETPVFVTEMSLSFL
jgi:hypothetical protein